MERLSWAKYFLDMATAAASRSSCGRRQVGTVIVMDKMIISTGYNGTPRGLPNCVDGGCRRFAENGNWPFDKSNCSHSEENAIVQAARCGTKIEGATLYCTHSPCRMCSKMIINSGIKSVVYKELYPDSEGALDMMRAAGVWVMIHEG